jgi:hypothetical protein
LATLRCKVFKTFRSILIKALPSDIDSFFSTKYSLHFDLVAYPKKFKLNIALSFVCIMRTAHSAQGKHKVRNLGGVFTLNTIASPECCLFFFKNVNRERSLSGPWAYPYWESTFESNL